MALNDRVVDFLVSTATMVGEWSLLNSYALKLLSELG